jgi:hypothetical protein
MVDLRSYGLQIEKFIELWKKKKPGESKPPFCLHYEKSSSVNIVSRKITWQKPRLHKRLYPIRVKDF